MLLRLGVQYRSNPFWFCSISRGRSVSGVRFFRLSCCRVTSRKASILRNAANFSSATSTTHASSFRAGLVELARSALASGYMDSFVQALSKDLFTLESAQFSKRRDHAQFSEYVQVLELLAEHDCKMYNDQILERLRHFPEATPAALYSMCLKFAAAKHFDLSLKLLKTIAADTKSIVTSDDAQIPQSSAALSSKQPFVPLSGQAILRAVIKADAALETIIDFCKTAAPIFNIVQPREVALNCAFALEKYDMAVKLLHVLGMKQVLTGENFRPLLSHYAKTRNLPDLLNTLQWMKTLKLHLTMDTFYAIVRHGTISVADLTVSNRMQAVQKEALICAFLKFHLKRGRLDEVKSLLDSNKVLTFTEDARRSLSSEIPSAFVAAPSQVEVLINLANRMDFLARGDTPFEGEVSHYATPRHMNAWWWNNSLDFNGLLLLDVCQRFDSEGQPLIFAKKMLEVGLRISRASTKRAWDLASLKQFSVAFDQVIDQLSQPSLFSLVYEIRSPGSDDCSDVSLRDADMIQSDQAAEATVASASPKLPNRTYSPFFQFSSTHRFKPSTSTRFLSTDALSVAPDIVSNDDTPSTSDQAQTQMSLAELKRCCSSNNPKDWSKAESLLSDCKAKGIALDDEVTSLVIQAYVKFSNAEMALEYFGEAVHRKLPCAFQQRIMLMLALLLSEKGMTNAALNVLALFWRPTNDLEYIETGKRILQNVARTDPPSMLERFIQTMNERNLCLPNGEFMQILIAACIRRREMHSAVRVFVEYANANGVVFGQNQLMCALISNSDQAGLQKVFDACSRTMGRNKALVSLAVNFADCGCIEHSHDVFKQIRYYQPDRWRVLWRWCNLFVRLEKPQTIANLLKATVGISTIPRDMQYHFLIKAYAEQNDWLSALNSFQSLEAEKDVVPRPETLEVLASLLRLNGQEVPFQLPPVQGEKWKDIDTATKRFVAPEDTDVVLLNVFEHIHGPAWHTIEKTARFLICEDRPKVATNLIELRFQAKPDMQSKFYADVVEKLFALKDTMCLAQLYCTLPRHRIDQFLVEQALILLKIERGFIDTAVKYLCAAFENDAHLRLNSYVAAIRRLAVHPVGCSHVAPLLEKALCLGQFDYAFGVWVEYLANDKEEEASILYEKYESEISRFLPSNIAVIARAASAKSNEKCFQKMLQVLRSLNSSNDVLGLAYSYYIGFKIRSRDLSGAEVILREALDNGLTLNGDVRAAVISDLRTKFAQSGHKCTLFSDDELSS